MQGQTLENVRDRRRDRRGKMAVMALLGAACSPLLSCSSTSAPLSVTMEHPETKQTLTCAAKDELARTDTSVLANAVENCAKSLEARGFIRKK